MRFEAVNAFVAHDCVVAYPGGKIELVARKEGYTFACIGKAKGD